MATRGDWKLRANGCRGVSWSDERFGANSLTTNSEKRTPAVWRSSNFKDTRPYFHGMLKKCTRVLLYVAVLSVIRHVILL